MFGFRRIKEMERELKELRHKYCELESRVIGCEVASTERVGELDPILAMAYRTDSRPTLTAMNAVRMIMSHLGLRVQSIEATPAKLELIEPPKGKK